MRAALALLAGGLLLAGCDPKGVYDGRPAPGTVTLGGLLCPPAFAADTVQTLGDELFSNGDVSSATAPKLAQSLAAPAPTGTWTFTNGYLTGDSASLTTARTFWLSSNTVNDRAGIYGNQGAGSHTGKYRFSFRVWLGSGFANTSLVYVTLQAFNSSVMLGEYKFYAPGDAPWGWVTVSSDLVFARDMNTVKLFITSNPGGTNRPVYFDDFSLRYISEATPAPNATPDPNATPTPMPEMRVHLDDVTLDRIAPLSGTTSTAPASSDPSSPAPSAAPSSSDPMASPVPSSDPSSGSGTPMGLTSTQAVDLVGAVDKLLLVAIAVMGSVTGVRVVARVL